MLFIYKFRPSPNAPTVLAGCGRIGANLLVDNETRPEGQRVNYVRIVEAHPDGVDFVVRNIRRRIGNRPFTGTVEAVGDSAISFNGRTIGVYKPKDPKDLNDVPHDLYRREGIERVVEATGARVDATQARVHRDGTGVKQVLVTANAKGQGAKNLFVGIDEDNYDPETDDVIGGASCTTGSASKAAEAMEECFGVEACFLSTTHAHTGDEQKRVISWINSGQRPQELTVEDEYAIETTGAAQGVEELVPRVRGRIYSAFAFRGPVVDGSYTQLNFVLRKEAAREEIVDRLKEVGLQFPRVLHVPEDLAWDDKRKAMLAPSVQHTGKVRKYNNSGVVAYLQGSGKFWTMVIGYDNEQAPVRAYNDLALYTEGRLTATSASAEAAA